MARYEACAVQGGVTAEKTGEVDMETVNSEEVGKMRRGREWRKMRRGRKWR